MNNIKRFGKLELFIIAILCLSFLQIASYGVNHILGRIQTNPFFADDTWAFGDLTVEENFVADLDPYDFETGSDSNAFSQGYPPMAYVVIWGIYTIGRNGTNAICNTLFLAVCFGTLIYLICKKLDCSTQKKELMAIATIMTGIVLSAYATGNIICVSAVLSAYYIFKYDSDNATERELAYIALAIAAAIKLYPAVLGVLTLADKRYKETVRLIIYGIVASFLPFFFFRGGIKCIPLLIRNIEAFSDYYKQVNHPVFNLKYWVVRISDYGLREIGYAVLTVIDKLLIVLGIINAFYDRKKWRKILIISMSMIYFSIHSGLYMALFFLPGMVLFFNEKAEKRDWIYVLLLVIIFNPLQIVFRGIPFNYCFINIAASVLYLIALCQSFCDIAIDKKITVNVDL